MFNFYPCIVLQPSLDMRQATTLLKARGAAKPGSSECAGILSILTLLDACLKKSAIESHWSHWSHHTTCCIETWLAAGGNAEPELYPRPDGSVYICGESDSVGVPDDPLSIQPREDACDNLEVSFVHPLSTDL